jgi:L-asparaginase
VLNEDIAAARDVWKTDNRRAHTFRSPELGFLGFADPDTVIFYRSPLRPHTWQAEFDLSAIDSLPHVEIAVDFTGFDGSTIDYLAGRRPDGIVLATFAGGRMSAGARRALAEAAEAGIPVVIASRVPGGRIVGNPLGDITAIVARDLPPHKARILLMLALTRTRAPGEIQSIFDTY